MDNQTVAMIVLQSARALAVALDREDYQQVQSLLAADCVYHLGEATLVGPDAIVASYRANSAAGRRRFDGIEFSSETTSTGPQTAVIDYLDRVRLGDAWHEYRCRQHVTVGSDGLVIEIRHDELPGERQRLEGFEAEHGRGTEP